MMFSESNKWVEEDLSKLTCKELKKLVRQSSVKANPNSKKADLVKALLNSSTANISFVDKNEVIENKTRLRTTRSRTSMFKTFVDIQDDSTDHSSKNTDTKSGKNYFDNEIASLNERTKKNKSKRKSEDKLEFQNKIHSDTANLHEKWELVSSVQQRTRPLTEITNSEVLDKDEFVHINCTDNKNMNKNKRTKSKRHVQKCSTENSSGESGPEPIIPFLKSELNENEEESLNSPAAGSCDDRKIQKKVRGKGKKAELAEKSVTKRPGSNKIETENPSTSNEAENINSDEGRVLQIPFSVNELGKKENQFNSPTTMGCDDKKSEKKTRARSKECKEPAENSVAHEAPVNADSIAILEFKNKPLTGKPNDFSESCRIEQSLTSNLKKNTKSTNSELHSSLMAESNEENKTSTIEKTPNMPVRSADVPSSTDSAGSSRKTRNSLKMNKFEAPVRSDTFIVGAGDLTPRSSMTKNQSDQLAHSGTFGVEEEDLPPVKPAPKLEKSIGKKIMSLAMKQGRVKPIAKKTSSSTLQKTISKTKNTNTPGTIYKSKFGVAKKLPNFKSIHQKLFNNMESIDDNKQRTLERAQALIASPAVPRCALLSPKPGLIKDPTSSKKTPDSNFLSPLVRAPAQTVTKAQTPAVAVAPKLIPASSSVNRFGFKKPVKRLDISKIAKKLPNTSLAKVKDQERQIVQGVRMNKRFLLQMKMREGKQ